MGEFMKQQFDKILVSIFTILAGCFLLHIMHHSGDSSNINQAWGVVTFFLGLLSGLITGRYVRSVDDKPLSINPDKLPVSPVNGEKP